MSETKKKAEFTMGLALFDAVPVILFGAAMIIVGKKLNNPLFFASVILCVVSALGKVTWKILMACVKKDYTILSRQMRILMPVGFVGMIVGVILADRSRMRELAAAAIRLPSAAFFVVTICCMCGMFYCAKHLDQKNASHNWIEQGINTVAQGCLLAGVLFL